jgi:hypothetical protein
MNGIMEFFSEYGWLVVAIFGIIYELVARYRPTERNLSILDFVHTVLNLFVPNKSKKDNTNDKVYNRRFKDN